MAVCNLFNTLENPSGNFLMFSQYIEDITKNYAKGNDYKVVPSRFVVLNIDYSKINELVTACKYDMSLNEAIPKYFQNCFENACAYGRVNYSKFAETVANVKNQTWTPEISRNLFWNFMFDGGLCTKSEYGNTFRLNEIVYWDDITIQTYDNHNGMGYGETYCYIPAGSGKKNCQVVSFMDTTKLPRVVDSSNKNILLEGHKDKYVEGYSQDYYYNRDYSMTFDDPSLMTLVDSSDSMYEFNTIVLLYDVYRKVGDNWVDLYKYIPMGIYFTGRFDGTNTTNHVRKYVTTTFGVGTSYGLRICTRFSVAPNGVILSDNETIIDSEDLSTTCRLMSTMSESLSLMMGMVKSMNDTTQQYKEILSTIRNNRTNVPYVKDVNGSDWWFVNGRPVTGISAQYDDCCNELSADIINQRIEAIKKTLTDENKDNDYMDFTPIYDGKGCECEAQDVETVVDHIKNCLDKEFEWNSDNDDCLHDIDFATNDDVTNILSPKDEE